MATSSALNLIIDITNPGKGGIIQSFQNRLPAAVPLFIRNDTETVALRFVQPSAGTSRPWDDVDYSTAQTVLAMGEFDAVPSTGTNTFQFGPRTTGTTNSTTTVTITGSTASIVNGMKVSGAGIVAGTTATISGSTVTLSVAATASASGVILYFYNETAGVAAGATATVVSTAVNALASVIAAGGVIITNPEAGVYLAVLTTTGITPGYFNGNSIGLNPGSSLIVSEVVVGAVGIASQQLIEIFVNAYALNLTWSAFPSASAVIAVVATGASFVPTGNNILGANTITSLSSTTGLVVGMSVSGVGIPVGTTLLALVSTTATLSAVTTAGSTGGVYTFTTPSVQTITLTPGAYDGSISITTPLLTTQAIAMSLTGIVAQAVQAALNALGANYVVAGNAGGPFTITDPTGSNTAFTVNVTNMIVPKGLTGSLILSTFAMLQKFISSGLVEITLDLECQVTPSGGGQSTPLQLSVLVNKNVINLSMLAPSPIPFGLTQAIADGRYLKLDGTNSPMSGDVDMGLNTMVNVEDPTNAQDVATKNYVDTMLSGDFLWSVKTANFTATNLGKYQVNTAGGAITGQTVVSPAVGNSFNAEDATLTWGTNNFTIGYNGTDKINGGTANYVSSLTGGKVNGVYISISYGWSIK